MVGMGLYSDGYETLNITFIGFQTHFEQRRQQGVRLHFGLYLRPPLNEKLFPVHCPSELKRAD